MNVMDRSDMKELRGILRQRTRYTVSEFAALRIPTLSLKPFSHDLENGKLAVESWTRESCLFVEGTMFAPMVNQRQGQFLDAAADMVALHRYIGGGSKGFLGNNPFTRKPGSTYFVDLTLSWEGIRDPGTIQSIYIPKSLIGFENGHHPSLLEICPPVRAARGLISQLNLLFGPIRRADVLMVKPTLDCLLACVKTAIGVPPEREDVRAQLRTVMFHEICNFIEYNLDSADLNASAVLESFGLSRASLYRMFEPHGGVRNYITERRAVRAVFDLAVSSGKRGAVRLIGERWGFATPVEFSRTMRRLYDSSPGALFRSAAPKAAQIAA